MLADQPRAGRLDRFCITAQGRFCGELRASKRKVDSLAIERLSEPSRVAKQEHALSSIQSGDVGPNQEPVTLQPMTKFPLVRDLIVDRQRMFKDLKTVKAWIQLDGSHELGPGPRQSQENQEEAYPLARCMTCGRCLEACRSSQ